MESLYGVRFNGSVLNIYKYKIIAEHPNGLLGLEILTPGFNQLAVHTNSSIHKDYLGKIREQDNAYIVYVQSINDIPSATDIIKERVATDKGIYQQAVSQRIAEFDAQLNTIIGADLFTLIKRADCE